MIARYLLCPGPVQSSNDRQVHMVGAGDLACLYGVPMADCVQLPPWRSSDHRHEMQRKLLLDRVERGELIALHPRYDGDYRLPGAAP